MQLKKGETNLMTRPFSDSSNCIYMYTISFHSSLPSLAPLYLLPTYYMVTREASSSQTKRKGTCPLPRELITYPCFSRPEVTLDLLGEDHVVLSRLLYTLGIVVHAAAHAPVSTSCQRVTYVGLYYV